MVVLTLLYSQRRSVEMAAVVCSILGNQLGHGGPPLVNPARTMIIYEHHGLFHLGRCHQFVHWCFGNMDNLHHYFSNFFVYDHHTNFSTDMNSLGLWALFASERDSSEFMFFLFLLVVVYVVSQI